MKLVHVLISILSILGTVFVLYYMKDRREKSNVKMKDKIVRLLKTNEFKILSQNKELKDLLLTPEFIDLGLTFGRDLVLEQLGFIYSKK